MKRWLCPGCERFFGRVNQSHECTPALTLAAYLARQPEAQRPVYRAVLAAVGKLKGIDIDPVEVGIMIKRQRTFCELRPKRAAVSLCFKLSRMIEHPRIARTVRCSAHRMAYFVDLRSSREVDGLIRNWLEHAYFDSPP